MNKQDFVDQLGKLRPASTFLSIQGYKDRFGGVSDYSICFHFSYENALKRSIEALNNIKAIGFLEEKAKKELIKSYNNSLNNMKTTKFEELEPHYKHYYDENKSLIKGVKLHLPTNTLHLYGLVAHKKVLLPSNYPERNKQELTIAKDKLRKYCPVDKFRQFKITPNQVNKITVEKLTLLPPI